MSIDARRRIEPTVGRLALSAAPLDGGAESSNGAYRGAPLVICVESTGGDQRRRRFRAFSTATSTRSSVDYSIVDMSALVS